MPVHVSGEPCPFTMDDDDWAHDQNGVAGVPRDAEAQARVPFDEGAMVVFAEGAMVPFDEGAMAPFAGPLVGQIRVGRVDRGYLYTREADGGLLWKCARPSDVGEKRGGQLGLVPRVVRR